MPKGFATMKRLGSPILLNTETRQHTEKLLHIKCYVRKRETLTVKA